MTPDLSIIILSWNVADLLAECLRSLPMAAGDWWERTEVLVVDNASTDNSADMVRVDFPHVRLIRLEANLGFSGGNNSGILASRGKYILLLNADTVPSPFSIARLADYLATRPDAGIVGPRLLNTDGTLQSSRRRFPTLATALIESTPLQKWLSASRVLRDYYLLDRPDGETQQVDWVSGAALMCRREALIEVGLLDPGYFMFSEEIDLCRRMAGAGWRIVYLPGAAIVHYGGQSTGRDVPARHIHFNTSKVRYFRLHEGQLAGQLMRLYLLIVYIMQSASEAAKWLAGHKRALRAARLRLYAQVLRSGLRERGARRPAAPQVLFITGEYPPAHGGVGDYTCKLSLALRRSGIHSRVLTGRPDVVSKEKNAKAQAQVETCAAPTLSTQRLTIGAVTRATRFTGARLVHIQYQTGAFQMRPTVNFLPILLRLLLRRSTVVTFHDLLPPYLFPKAGQLRHWANLLLARSASAVVTTNPEDAARLRKWGVRQVSLIPIGSNIRTSPPSGYKRDAWRAARSIASGTVLLAYFGFLNSSKGLDDLLNVVAGLRESGDFRLMLIGGGTGASDPTNSVTAARLGALLVELGLQDRLIWTGYLPPEEVSAALLSADMAVLPFADGASFRRGSLLAVLAHGLPLVTTRAASSHNADAHNWPTLRDGQAALLVEIGDRTALAQAIRRLSEDAELRGRLSSKAVEVAGYFSWERIAQMHVDLYRKLLGHSDEV